MRITRLLKFTALCTAVIALGSCNKTPMFGKVSIDKIIKELTLEEKADLLVGTHAFWGDTIDPAIQEVTKSRLMSCMISFFPSAN